MTDPTSTATTSTATPTGLLANKVVLVTGASSGIGEAAARLFAREGASVVLAATDDTLLEEVTRSITADGGTASWVAADVSVAEDVQHLLDQTLQRYGRLDGAFNNAGISQGGARLGDLDGDRFDQLLSINVKGVWLCMRAEVAAMGDHGGAIVNTASIAGLRGRPGLATYAASKHAVIGLTRSGALDYGQAGIRINAVAPGTVDTPMTSGWLEQEPALAAQLKAMTPLGRSARPEEIAEAAAWLLSDRASYVTGAVLTMDGGMTA